LSIPILVGLSTTFYQMNEQTWSNMSHGSQTKLYQMGIGQYL
jgi:hypothetical protein